jgi:DNA-binding transcriptional LysR family regulator
LAIPPLDNLSSELRNWLRLQKFSFDSQLHHVVDDIQAIQDLVLNHGCIGFNLEGSLMGLIDQNSVVKLFVGSELPTKPLTLLYRKSTNQNSTNEAFKQFILRKYQETSL